MRRLKSIWTWIWAVFVVLPTTLIILLPPIFAEQLQVHLDPKNPHYHVPVLLRFFVALVIAATVIAVIDRRRQEEPSGIDRSNRRFMKKYQEALVQSIIVLSDLPKMDRAQLAKAQQAILDAIRSVVAGCFGDKSGLQINANLMIQIPVDGLSAGDIPGLLFVDPMRELKTYRSVLWLVQWASESHCVPNPLSLPIDKDKKRVLLGAPAAVESRTIQVIPDIRDEKRLAKMLAGQPPSVADELKQYFADRTTFRSFASIPLVKDNEVIGVLNVQSNRPNIFGDTLDFKEQVSGLIDPLAVILSSIAATGVQRQFYALPTTPRSGAAS